MDFDLSEEQRLAVDAARRFLEQDIRPYAEQYRDTVVPKPVMHELLRKIVPFGYIVGSIPERDGGMGLPVLTSGLLYEQLFRVFPGLAGTAFINEGFLLTLYHDGTPEQRARYLPGLMSGDLIGCSAITEPNVGSNVRNVSTKATPAGDGYVINGQKNWISNGGISDACIVVVRHEDAAKGLNRFVVDREPHGYTTRELHKLGLNAWSTAEVFFDNARVPASAQVGAWGTGLKRTLQLFEWARCFVAITSVGIAQSALDHSLAYAQEREQWGKRIGQHQLIQDMIADMATELDCARLLTYRAMSLVDKGARCDTQTSMAKYYATEAAVRITSRAIQIHGAYGLSQEYPLEGLFRDARMMTIPDGTSQIQKLVIARNLLGGLSAFGEAPRAAAAGQK
ncbi:MAG: acyl-CoA/acyl-ACP dehydrogenase [Candidatus Lambdaproteobacteria bacterium]|nr:acyl-CoA/acyl-ACP dehydrogenase [Candidatus Lambdaproteobacteria bacterium]